MAINKKLLCLTCLLILILFSCQTKTIVSYEKYENLDIQEKKAVDEYLTDAKKFIPKKEDDTILMFQYRCFFDKNLKLNNGYKAEFPQFANKNHYDKDSQIMRKSLEM